MTWLLWGAEGPWVVIDGYHAFMALDPPFSPSAAASAFYLAGGYKYAMAGEGMGLHGLRRRDSGPAAGYRLVRRVRGSDPAAGQGRLCPRRDALHGRDLRSVGTVPLQRRSAGCSPRMG